MYVHSGTHAERAAPVWDIWTLSRGKEKRDVSTCSGSLRFCSEVVHVAFTHSSLASASHVTEPDVHGAGSTSPTGKERTANILTAVETTIYRNPL